MKNKNSLLDDLEKIYYSLDCITIDKTHCFYCIYCRNVKMCKTIKTVIDSIKNFY